MDITIIIMDITTTAKSATKTAKVLHMLHLR
jgi:hypothetical protein